MISCREMRLHIFYDIQRDSTQLFVNCVLMNYGLNLFEKKLIA